ncbi:hypothetical protein SK128_009516 [Halocaridina rubra]|uniref:Uncharacterized protein n=1 Tax=Halocaridina rubra TaxID=373956 RepID=A0AAN8WV55_HALRR
MACQGLPNPSGIVVLILLIAATSHYSYHTLNDLQERFRPDCNQGCIQHHVAGAPKWNDKDLLETIKENFIVPPPIHPNRSVIDINFFVWKDLIDWDKIQNYLLELWKDRPPGTFVEIGAVDGEFMSQTLLLERNLSWSGLLIEPDPRSFKLLRDNHRNASITDFCVLQEPPKAEILWMHHLANDLPQQYIALMMARSKLAFDTLVQEIDRGSRVYVKCAPLSTLLLAASMTKIDFLSIATGTSNDQEKLTDVTKSTKVFDVKTLLIQYTRSYLLGHPYPEIKGYLHDMGRSALLVRFYWRKSHCQLLDKNTCKRLNYWDLMEACFKYLCDGHATVWSYE